MSEMIERVAEALDKTGDGSMYSLDQSVTWICCGKSFSSVTEARAYWRRSRAIAAIAALREPTEAMVRVPIAGFVDVAEYWEAMIDAALGETEAGK